MKKDFMVNYRIIKSVEFETEINMIKTLEIKI